MSVETIIKHRTQAKEIRLSGALCMIKEEWLALGGIYQGSLGTAARNGYLTVRGCEKLGQPVTDNEYRACKNFAMMKDCYVEYMIYDKIGAKRCPCLPVFYRGAADTN